MKVFLERFLCDRKRQVELLVQTASRRLSFLLGRGHKFGQNLSVLACRMDGMVGAEEKDEFVLFLSSGVYSHGRHGTRVSRSFTSGSSTSSVSMGGTLSGDGCNFHVQNWMYIFLKEINIEGTNQGSV